MTDDRTAGALERSLAACRDCPIEIVIWSRGGPPGPGFTSDQLTVTRRDGLISATYLRARFDPAYETNFRATRFRAGLNTPMLDDLLGALRTSRLFDERQPSEDRGNIADGLKDSYTVTIDQDRFEKTLIQSDEAALAPLKEVRNRIAGFVAQSSDVAEINARKTD